METKQIQPVDFQRMIRTLCVLRMSVHEIALHANIPRTSIRDYQNGTQPLHMNGERLIRLWCEKTGNHRDQVPRRGNSELHGVISAGCPARSY